MKVSTGKHQSWCDLTCKYVAISTVRINKPKLQSKLSVLNKEKKIASLFEKFVTFWNYTHTCMCMCACAHTCMHILEYIIEILSEIMAIYDHITTWWYFIEKSSSFTKFGRVTDALC